jgi:exonuclease III
MNHPASRLALKKTAEHLQRSELPSKTYAAGNSLLASLHAERRSRYSTTTTASNATTTITTVNHPTTTAQQLKPLRVITYNIWFNTQLMDERLTALGNLLSSKDPDVVLLQEVTHYSYSRLTRQSWCKDTYIMTPPSPTMTYFTSIFVKKKENGGSLTLHNDDKTATTNSMSCFEQLEFPNSNQGRDLKILTAAMHLPGGGTTTTARSRIKIATSHLESPTGWKEKNVLPRKEQMKRCFEHLSSSSSKDEVIYIWGGDMNWNETDSGPVPLPDGWIDGWKVKYPTDPGYTYDAKTNPMLSGGLRLRLDRVFCRLNGDWRMGNVEMIGTEVIPGVEFIGRGKGSKEALPSDHFGLLVDLLPPPLE